MTFLYFCFCFVFQLLHNTPRALMSKICFGYLSTYQSREKDISQSHNIHKKPSKFDLEMA